ncbi:7TM chemoreceptor [Ancylostoma caninum]|uniref:7TM chemoreceptor n=1 Tax=Ancylostoma caninum TaxID=29170 RepID=A0A368GZ18_ANCCA|nr:7TM chemoreceptor [Ancylostoma caninum]
MYFSTNDAIYFGAICVSATGGIIANALLLYLIFYRSPKHLSPYRILLGNTALTQLLLAGVIVTIAPRKRTSSLHHSFRVLTEGFSIANIYLGPSQFLGPWCSYMLYITMLHLALNSFMSLMVSMIYRCIVLRVSTISAYGAVLMCLAGYALPFSMLPSCVNMQYSANTTKAAEVTHYIVPHMDKYSVIVTASILQPCILWAIFCCSFVLIPIYATMYFCRWKILTFLERASVVQSTSTRINTKRLVKALTIQSLVPTLSIFPPAIAYLLIQFGILGPQLFSYFIAPCLSIGPLIDPMITIYYVSPYRHFVSSTLLSHYVPSIASDTNQWRPQTSKTGYPPTTNSQNVTAPL